MSSGSDTEQQQAAIELIEHLGGTIRRGKSGKVRAVDLRTCGPAFTDEHAEHLAAFPDLAQLELAGTGITDASLSHVGSLTRLGHLDLQNTAITAHGLSHLESLTRLKLLLLSGTNVQRDQLTPLRQKLLNARIVLP